MEKISINQVYKIFGPHPKEAMLRLEDGAGKEELLAQTGHVIGIQDVSLSIRRGETFVIMGLSGSGKSTLIRHINRLIEPTAGRILIDGQDVLAMNARQLRQLRRTKISMVFQRFGLLPHKTVLENVASGLRIQGISRTKARQLAAEQVELVGLAGFEERYIRQLSGGMQQRVGLARALASDAEILLMDEAFSALDPLIRNDMQQQLIELQHRLHKTIVFITHDLDEALRLGDHIAILKDGALRQTGTPGDILMNPADDHVRRFVRDVNRGRVVTAGSIASDVPKVRLADLSLEHLATMFGERKCSLVYVLDDDRRPLGVVAADMLKTNGSGSLGPWTEVSRLRPIPCVSAKAVVEEMLPLVARDDGPIAVVDDQGRFLGSVSRERAINALARPSG